MAPTAAAEMDLAVCDVWLEILNVTLIHVREA